MLPDFLCIGAQKAATTWLHVHLATHPELWLPPIKELQYFNHLFIEDDRRWTHRHLGDHARAVLRRHVNAGGEIDLDYVGYVSRLATEEPFTEAWYRRAFDRPEAAGRLRGDVTPAYCAIGAAGIAYLRSLLAAVKVIYIIRDPVERALSHLRMIAEHRGVAAPDDAKWEEFAAEPMVWAHSAYSEHVPLWRAAFAPGDLLFLPYGRVAANPLGVLREVELFLGVKPHGYSGLDQRIHATGSKTVSGSLRDRLEARLGPERAFVRNAFGSEFAAAI
ncbi:MAG TPA: sulfotransferase [Hyphomicrobiales bacterium]|nr:sulfotransferase [Hyphomicrobiales bacterium]